MNLAIAWILKGHVRRNSWKNYVTESTTAVLRFVVRTFNVHTQNITDMNASTRRSRRAAVGPTAGRPSPPRACTENRERGGVIFGRTFCNIV